MPGFLAALGTLVALSDPSRDDAPRLGWLRVGGQWTAFIGGLPDGVERNNLPEWLAERLKSLAENPAVRFAKDLAVSGEQFRYQALQAARAATLSERSHADFLAAFGCDVVVDKKGLLRDTSFRTMSGAGNQHFLESMRKLAELTTARDLEHALFEPWAYTDELPSMRWDARDDRRYALRWKNPSNDPGRTVRGANRLAVEALRLLPTAPVGRGIATTGFRRVKRETHFTWPIWEAPLSADAVRSLMGMAAAELAGEVGERNVAQLQARGVRELFRSTRRTAGKFVVFTPPVPATVSSGVEEHDEVASQLRGG